MGFILHDLFQAPTVHSTVEVADVSEGAQRVTSKLDSGSGSLISVKRAGNLHGAARTLSQHSKGSSGCGGARAGAGRPRCSRMARSTGGSVRNVRSSWPGRRDRSVVTTVGAVTNRTPAELYHQDYLQKNSGGYTCHGLRDW